jgi:hypothetical protein
MKDKADSGNWVGTLALFVLFFVVYHGWNSKLRYAFQYGANYDDVTKDQKPHDCDWLKAPIGDKECHYDMKVLVTEIRSTDQKTGRPIVSYDGGISWVWNPDATLNTSSPAAEADYHPSPGNYPIRKIIYIVWLKVTE